MPIKNNHTHSKNARKQNQIFSEELNISTPCRYTYYIYITMQKGCLISAIKNTWKYRCISIFSNQYSNSRMMPYLKSNNFYLFNTITTTQACNLASYVIWAHGCSF
jgi:hypothetical protein